MVGLLQKLNKRPRRGGREPSSSKIILPEKTGSPKTAGNTGTSFEIPRSASSDSIAKRQTVSSDQIPWWVSEPPQLSPQLNAVIASAWQSIREKVEAQTFDDDDFRKMIQRAVADQAQTSPSPQPLTSNELKIAARDLWNFFRSKGPLEALYEDPFVTDIFVTHHNAITCRRGGTLFDTPFSFHSAEAYDYFINSLLSREALLCDIEHPIQNCVIRDFANSRISVIHRSLLATADHSLMIRVPRLPQVSFYELIRTKTLPAAVAAWLTELVATRACSILITGPSGSGKTTIATALLSATPSESRIITIEDTAELAPAGRRLEKFLVKSDEKARRNTERLLDAALHRAPDWIAFGDLPPGESGLLLRAFESGSALLLTMPAPNVHSAFQILVDDLMRERSVATIEECAKRFYAGFNLVLTMDISGGRPYVKSIAERSATTDPLGYVDIIRFSGNDGDKRVWELCRPSSEWIKVLEKRGHFLRIGGSLLAAAPENEI